MVDPPFSTPREPFPATLKDDSARCRYWRAFLNFRQSHRNGPRSSLSPINIKPSLGVRFAVEVASHYTGILSDGCTENSHVNVLIARENHYLTHKVLSEIAWYIN